MRARRPAVSVLAVALANSSSLASPLATADALASPLDASTTLVASPGHSLRSGLPAPTALAPPSPLPPLNSPAAVASSAARLEIEGSEDAPGGEGGEVPHELHRRQDNLCDGCGPYTSIKSFRGASKTLTKSSDEYPKARRTVVTTKKKRVFTTENCKTTTFKKVKQTMYVLWVRQEGFANVGGASTSRHVIASLPLLFLSILIGSLFVLLR